MYEDKKQLEISLGKNSLNYKTIRNKTSVFEQKPIEVNDFNEIEEKQVINGLKNENRNVKRLLKKINC